jgi:hypothetical protein
MNTIAPHAPYIVSGLTPPSNSASQNWYQNLGNSNTNPNAFNLATEFAAAKSKQTAILGNSVFDHPYYNIPFVKLCFCKKSK